MTLRQHVLVFVVLVALVCAVTWPLARDPGHSFPPHHDPYLFSWVMLTAFRNLLHQPGALLHGNAFYPLGNSLTFSEPLIGPGLVAGPIFALSGNPVLAYNVTLVALWALSGWAMYLLAWRLTGRHAAAWVAALVFTLSAYRTAYHLEVQMEFVYGLPLAVYFLVRFAETHRSREFLGMFLALWVQALAVWYYTIITMLALVVLGTQQALLRWRVWRPRPLAAIAAGAVLFLLASAPIAAPYFETRAELGFERQLVDAADHSADVLTYVDSGPNRWYHFEPVSRVSVETSLFPGFAALLLSAVSLLGLRAGNRATGPLERGLTLTIVAGLALGLTLLLSRGLVANAWTDRAGTGATLAGCGVLVAALAKQALAGYRGREKPAGPLSRPEWIRALLVLALSGFLLSLGPVVHLAGQKIGTGLYAWLYPIALPLHAIRVTTRIGVLVVFAIALMAAFGTKSILDRAPRRAPLLGVLIPLIVAVEYQTSPLPYDRVDWGARAPVYRLLERLPHDVTVLELPMTADKRETPYMFYSLGHRKRLVNGFSGFVPPLTARIQRTLARCGRQGRCEAVAPLLQSLEPQCYVVVHPATVRRLRRLFRESPWAQLVAGFGETRVYRIVSLVPSPRVERLFSWDYARDREAIVIRRPAGVPPAATPARAELNGELISPVTISTGQDAIVVPLSDALRRADANRLVLIYGRGQVESLRPVPRPGPTTRFSAGRAAHPGRPSMAAGAGWRAHGQTSTRSSSGGGPLAGPPAAAGARE